MSEQRRWPVAPKAYGALGGAGTGGMIAAVIVGLIQEYVTHKPLSGVAVQAIYAAVPFVMAGLGAWLAPHQPRPGGITRDSITGPASKPPMTSLPPTRQQSQGM